MRLLPVPVITCMVFACSNHPPPPSALQSGGTVVDDGGDQVNCRSEAGAALVGALSLDYVLTYSPDIGVADDPGEDDVDALLDRVTALIAAKLPELSSSWADYRRLIEVQDNSEPRIWRASSEPLTDVVNTDPVRDFPENCQKMGAGGEPEPDLTQLVRRRYFVVDDVPKILYEFDDDALGSLRTLTPLQYVYLVTHEWLWDFVEAPYGNRWINRLLHSQSTAGMTPAAVRDYLRSHGFQADADGILGQPSPLAAELQALAESTPSCDAERRASITFDADVARLVVDGGETLAVPLKTPRLDELLGSGACGVGFFYGYRSSGPGQAGGTIELRRGGAAESVDVSAGSTRRQGMMHGMCKPGDQACNQRVGQLGLFFWPSETGVTSWELRIKNTSSGRLEVTLPHLTFYGVR